MDKVNLENELKNNDAVMLYFSGNDCGVCKVLQPKVSELFTQKFPKIKQLYISAEDFRETAVGYNVLTIPTVIVFFENKEFLRKSRHISIVEVETELERVYSLYFT